MILDFGQRLRSAFYGKLPLYADTIRLAEKKDLFEFHADFLSRLAMTFSHGDYATIEAIPKKEEVAERLYNRSLSYAPNERSYLGLGSLKQKQRRYKESIRILSEGMNHFPESEQIALCLGISHMCLAQHNKALHCFSKCPDTPEVAQYRESCCRLLGFSDKRSVS